MKERDDFLAEAIDLSKEIALGGGFPVGAIIVVDGVVIARGVSDGKRHHDPTWHAEIDAIRRACALLGTRSLKNATLYSSMEPCLMCYSACYWANIGQVVYACSKDKLDKIHYEKGSDLVAFKDMMKSWTTEIIHNTEQEVRALQVVAAWERSISSKGDEDNKQ